MKIHPGPTPPPIRGFRFAGVHGGLKARGRRDFAIIAADRPVVAAALFTRNRAAAAPVSVSRRHIEDGRLQAIMVNSGNANAGTGARGIEFAEWSCRQLAVSLCCEADLILPCSTGVIGVELERRPFARAVSIAADGLSRGGFAAAARAIMTSDAFPKWSFRTCKAGNGRITVAGMAKGAGMIHPDMATMLAFVLTDADLTAEAARVILQQAAAGSFHIASVDGDTSTNDTLALMASGEAAGGRIEAGSGAGFEALRSAVCEVCEDLARMIVRDGEGASKLVDVFVEGMATDEQASRAADSIVRSTLVKAAFAGADPNWGRLLMAVGNAGVDFDALCLTVTIDDVVLVADGSAVSAEAARKARKAMRKDAFTLGIGFGDGPGRAHRITSDLTEAYVHFNSAYTS